MLSARSKRTTKNKGCQAPVLSPTRQSLAVFPTEACRPAYDCSSDLSVEPAKRC